MTVNNRDFVTVYLEGLMISCFNQNLLRFESVLLRKEDHDFSILIKKYKDVEVVEETFDDKIPLKNIRLEIEGRGNPAVEGFKKFEANSFDRKNEEITHPNDFRWIVDLEGVEFHGKKLQPTGESESKYKMPLNPLYIKNAEFFISDKTEYLNDKIEKDAEGNIVKREFFGRYGFILGARINAEKVYWNFEGTTIPEKEAGRDEGFTYRIFITNTRQGGDEESELPVYYRVLKDESGRNFNLEKLERNVELYWKTGNCGKVFLGETETIENLS